MNVFPTVILAIPAWISQGFAFIAGFLLTAIPRFTGTHAPSLRTQYLLAAIIALSTAATEIAIGTRVSLSHGGHNLAAERKSWPLRIGLTTGLIAMRLCT